MIKVCLDTNIFVSALVFGGKCQEITDFISLGKIDLVLSPAILNETSKVLRDKFEKSDEEVRRAIRLFLALGFMVEPKKKLKVLPYDSDNRILECAVEGKADYLVTGDKKHLLKLKDYKGIKILSPGEFLRKINDKQ